MSPSATLQQFESIRVVRASIAGGSPHHPPSSPHPFPTDDTAPRNEPTERPDSIHAWRCAAAVDCQAAADVSALRRGRPGEGTRHGGLEPYAGVVGGPRGGGDMSGGAAAATAEETAGAAVATGRRTHRFSRPPPTDTRPRRRPPQRRQRLTSRRRARLVPLVRAPTATPAPPPPTPGRVADHHSGGSD